MNEFPNHVAYRRRPGGKSFHAVAEDAEAEALYRTFVEQNGYVLARMEPVTALSDRERRQFLDHEALGVRLKDDRPSWTPEDDNRGSQTDLPF